MKSDTCRSSEYDKNMISVADSSYYADRLESESFKSNKGPGTFGIVTTRTSKGINDSSSDEEIHDPNDNILKAMLPNKF